MIPSVQTPAEVISHLPKPAMVEAPNIRLEKTDWLVMCAGFEDRSLAVLKKAIERREQFRVLLISYLPAVGENRGEDIRAFCRRESLELVELTYDREAPSGFGYQVLRVLAASGERIFVDISAMSRLLIVQIVAALRSRKCGYEGCNILYTQAARYSPSEDEAQAELLRCKDDPTSFVVFLTSGIFEITIVPELSSVAPAGNDARLISFPSLDAHHLLALRAEAHASKYTFIEGRPPSPSNAWRQELIAQLNRMDEFTDAERFVTSTLDYVETLDCLLGIYQRHGVRERLMVAPTGSKMQAVAVGLFRAFIEDIQIVYPTPKGFQSPQNYTSGIGSTHLLPLAGFHI